MFQDRKFCRLFGKCCQLFLAKIASFFKFHLVARNDSNHCANVNRPLSPPLKGESYQPSPNDAPHESGVYHARGALPPRCQLPGEAAFRPALHSPLGRRQRSLSVRGQEGTLWA